ncbi:sugar ABC transporter [Pandoraea capi]|uniref:Sugar ABC transporter n=1 Tax=Pandoraea capi TaxID=2508286 RepID=A0ABY6VRT1_9BURK|nr:sugar ABC transporter [Pandoraea capi]VVD80911.1 sugar ABC transporter [Pandoraea capi]
MIYTVECNFADAASEAEWNAFYSLEKLPALISVTGFHTSQRFRAMTGGCPAYLAIHTVYGLDVLTGDEYRRKGGGNFARWQQHITDWHRNLYSDIGPAPAVQTGERLALCSLGPAPLIDMGLKPLAMHAVALDKCPTSRWLAVLPTHDARQFAHRPEGVDLYAPMGDQLTSARRRAPEDKRERN